MEMSEADKSRIKNIDAALAEAEREWDRYDDQAQGHNQARQNALANTIERLGREKMEIETKYQRPGSSGG